MAEPITTRLVRLADFDLNGNGKIDFDEHEHFTALDSNNNGVLDTADSKATTPEGVAALQALHEAGLRRHDAYEKSRNLAAKTNLRWELLSAFKIVAALAPPGSTQKSNACHNLREYRETNDSCGR